MGDKFASPRDGTLKMQMPGMADLPYWGERGGRQMES